MPSCCTTWARRSAKARGPACALSSKREKASSPRTTPSSTTLHGPGGTRKSSFPRIRGRLGFVDNQASGGALVSGDFELVGPASVVGHRRTAEHLGIEPG